ncbi:unnamed protein product [Rhizophagus irregularis]|nr:unnamed protein product [Rhizophagus irregularis]
MSLNFNVNLTYMIMLFDYMGLQKKEVKTLAYQLVCAISCLHDEGIIHRDLHSDNIIKSDVYSIGVLLWEISSGKLPFEDESYDAGLVMRILQGYRETIVPNTPSDYSKLYTECWNSEPDNRPTMDQVVVKLKEIIMKTNVIVNSQMRIDSDNVDKSNVNLLNLMKEMIKK